MENLMRTYQEAANAVITGTCGYPRFTLTADESARIKDACERAKISGPLMDKVMTMVNFAAAKAGYSGRVCIVKME